MIDRITTFYESPVSDRYGVTVRNFIVDPMKIKRVVCNFFSISEQEICFRRRKRNIVFPRQVAMYVMTQHTDLSLQSIGSEFGDYDHTTVVHSREVIRDLMCSDPDVRKSVKEIERTLCDLSAIIPTYGNRSPGPAKLIRIKRPTAIYSNHSPYNLAK
jgi:hypothetical protein